MKSDHCILLAAAPGRVRVQRVVAAVDSHRCWDLCNCCLWSSSLPTPASTHLSTVSWRHHPPSADVTHPNRTYATVAEGRIRYRTEIPLRFDCINHSSKHSSKTPRRRTPLGCCLLEHRTGGKHAGPQQELPAARFPPERHSSPPYLAATGPLGVVGFRLPGLFRSGVVWWLSTLTREEHACRHNRLTTVRSSYQIARPPLPALGSWRASKLRSITGRHCASVRHHLLVVGRVEDEARDGSSGLSCAAGEPKERSSTRATGVVAHDGGQARESTPAHQRPRLGRPRRGPRSAHVRRQAAHRVGALRKQSGTRRDAARAAAQLESPSSPLPSRDTSFERRHGAPCQWPPDGHRARQVREAPAACSIDAGCWREERDESGNRPAATNLDLLASLAQPGESACCLLLHDGVLFGPIA